MMIFLLFIYLFQKGNVVSAKLLGALECKFHLKYSKIGELVAGRMKAERIIFFFFIGYNSVCLFLFYCKHKDNLILIQNIHNFTRKYIYLFIDEYLYRIKTLHQCIHYKQLFFK